MSHYCFSKYVRSFFLCNSEEPLIKIGVVFLKKQLWKNFERTSEKCHFLIMSNGRKTITSKLPGFIPSSNV